MLKITTPPIIDVEASGFGGFSYPIEVGVVLEDGKKFCSLIAPYPEWTHWDEEAEKIHRVSRNTLKKNGKCIREVTETLNEFLCGKTVYTDAWVVDKPWLITLFHASGMSMNFETSPLEMILSEGQMEIWHETKDKVINKLGLNRHRASNDALIIQETFKQTLEITERRIS